MKEVKLTLSVEEANTILGALGNMPFIQVHELISKIQQQAGQQFNAQQNGQPEKTATDKEKK